VGLSHNAHHYLTVRQIVVRFISYDHALEYNYHCYIIDSCHYLTVRQIVMNVSGKVMILSVLYSETWSYSHNTHHYLTVRQIVMNVSSKAVALLPEHTCLCRVIFTPI
jgi:hypothetical protein